ncbi:MAG: hypothetical protein U0984_06810 [Prosthecobacter sp.]|nr:hypothetical protein [Prosthecobacter sp.]
MSDSPPKRPHEAPTTPWTQIQLHHVENELATEYPNLPRQIIHLVVTQTQATLESSQGTVRLLALARKNLTTATAPGGTHDQGDAVQLSA